MAKKQQQKRKATSLLKDSKAVVKPVTTSSEEDSDAEKVSDLHKLRLDVYLWILNIILKISAREHSEWSAR